MPLVFVGKLLAAEPIRILRARFMQFRRPLLALLLTLAALIAFGFWLDAHKNTARRTAAWREQKTIARYYEVLDKPLTAPRGSYHLLTYCDLLAERTGVPIALSDAAQTAILSEGLDWIVSPPETKSELSGRMLLQQAIAPRAPALFHEEIEDYLLGHQTGVRPRRSSERAELTQEELGPADFPRFGGRTRGDRHE